MTDLERAKALFADLGLEPREEVVPYDGEERTLLVFEEWQGGHDLATGESTPVTRQPRVQGYGGFFCHFSFDPDGTFYRVGIYE